MWYGVFNFYLNPVVIDSTPNINVILLGCYEKISISAAFYSSPLNNSTCMLIIVTKLHHFEIVNIQTIK